MFAVFKDVNGADITVNTAVIACATRTTSGALLDLINNTAIELTDSLEIVNEKLGVKTYKGVPREGLHKASDLLIAYGSPMSAQELFTRAAAKGLIHTNKQGHKRVTSEGYPYFRNFSTSVRVVAETFDTLLGTLDL